MEHSTEYLQELMAIMPGAAAVYQVRDDGLVLRYCSAALPALLGLTQEEYRVRTAGNNLNLIIDSDVKRVKETIDHAVASGEDVTWSHRIYLGEGYRWMNVRGRVIGTLDGAPVFLAVFADTTTEAQMHEQLLNQANDAIYVCDRSTYELFYLNQPARDFWNISGDAIGHTCYEVLRGFADPCPWCPIDAMHGGKGFLEHEGGPNNDRYLRADYRELAWYGLPALCATVKDLTEEHEARTHLAEAEQKLDSIIDNIPSGVGIFDVTGDTVKLGYLNDGYYRMLGSSRSARADFAGTNVVAAIHPDDLPGILTEAHESIAQKRLFHRQFRIQLDDGGYRWVSISASHEPLDHTTERFYAAYYDIDEMMKAQNELAENKERLEHVLTSIPAAIGVYREDNGAITVERANKSMRSVTGNPETRLFEESLDDLIEDYIHPDDVAVARAGFKALFSPAHEALFSYRNRVEETGDYRWLQCRGRSFPQSDGSQIAYAVFADITESAEARLSAERQLAEEKLRMKSLQGDILAASCFNVTQDRSIDLNNNDNLQYETVTEENAEREAVAVDDRINGQRGETKNVLLSAAEQIPDPAQRRDFIRTCSHFGMVDAYERGKRQINLEYRRNTGKGLIWVRTRIEFLTDPMTGDLLAFFYTTDIDTQKIQQLIDKRVIENDYEFIGVIDVPKHSVRAIETLLPPVGSSPESEVDHDTAMEIFFRDLIDPEEIDDLLARLSFARITAELENQTEYQYAFTMVDPSGTRSRKQVRYAYLDDMKDLIFVTGADITIATKQEQEQRDRLKEALHAANAANAAKSDFLARMSHDIRTPLNGVIGMTGLALDEEDPATIRDYLEKIDESGKFLLSLVNDILDVAKVESGTVELHPEPYPYAEFRQYILSIIEPLCRSKGLAFHMSDMGEHVTLLLDRLRANQIFFNLLSNAVKFTPQGGHVRFDVNHSPNADSSATVTFIVSDDGIGMSKEFQEHLFEPFSQEHTAMSDSRTGTGLGLSIAREFVDLMGGTIEVESALGKGTTFTVTLTADIAADVDESEDVERLVSLDGMHVLAAEDNAINAEIVVRLLQKRNAETTVAVDGEEAIKLFEDSDVGFFDAILMDVRMPNVDGLQATKRIRALARPDAATVPIFAMTANAFDEDVRECLDAGMDAHIAKPIDPHDLYQTLEQAKRHI